MRQRYFNSKPKTPRLVECSEVGLNLYRVCNQHRGTETSIIILLISIVPIQLSVSIVRIEIAVNQITSLVTGFFLYILQSQLQIFYLTSDVKLNPALRDGSILFSRIPDRTYLSTIDLFYGLEFMVAQHNLGCYSPLS